MAQWIDSHVHLESFFHRGELDGVLERAREAGVGKVITVGTSPEDWPLYERLARDLAPFVSFTAGLHPCDVGEAWEKDLDALRTFLDSGAAPVAIGESGLDRFHLPKDEAAAETAFARQEAAFRAHIELAGRHGLPLVVHSRGAFRDCVRVLDEAGADWDRVVFHCFADGPDAVRELNRRGGRASFTGIATYRNAEGVREALRAQGTEKLMVETDAPYLAPVPHRGKRNEPAWVRHTGERAAEVLDVPPEKLAEITTANAADFFGLRS